ncbi:hypothetical protein NM688_g1364 [Phlebia brevispora]|uniref:Uncharacterized protein n=1 Tax=Phlebia brevispora TaxID=194682 RepID=A0ACC1TBD9_9APHY|nr:hypothetical protein NM688_g1364 [Phlebia brevispora]
MPENRGLHPPSPLPPVNTPATSPEVTFEDWSLKNRKLFLQMLDDLMDADVRSTAESLEPLRIACRMIPRLFNAFSDIECLLLDIGAILNQAADPDMYKERILELDENQRADVTRDFKDLMRVLSCIRKDLPLWVEDDLVFRTLIDFVSVRARLAPALIMLLPGQ